MLKLKGIKKDYSAGDSKVEALRGIDLEFGESEFAAILGPSGCGKTTLLNIVGGLDHYSEGDLIIRGKSTREFTESDWDIFRNHSVGFVFQSYNLIPHQTILSNVELALTLSGVSSAERKERAKKALEQVGLEEHIYKKPNQLSGGQMQRVAIARALINNPEILLADEPTGALDSDTSVQVMNILKDIAKDRLVIMVTHNPELAYEYANRIVRLVDGKITEDSNPYVSATVDLEKVKRIKNRSMSFWTSFMLSLNNLLTKKLRTFMTAFAGSIGIMGIALILAVSTGFQAYIDKIEEDTMSSYPLTITRETVDATSAILGMISDNEEVKKVEGSETVRERQYMTNMFSSIGNNDLKSFKAHLDTHTDEIREDVNLITYTYSISPIIYTVDAAKKIVQLNPNSNMSRMMSGTSSLMGGGRSGVFNEMLTDISMLEENYTVLKGRWPEAYNEMIIVLSEPNSISDLLAYNLGLKDTSELKTVISEAMNNENSTVKNEPLTITYDELLNREFKLVDAADLYSYNEKYDIYEDMRDNEEYIRQVYADSEPLKIVGIVCAKEGGSSMALSSGVNYTHALTEHVIAKALASEIVKRQMANQEIDVFSNKRFDEAEEREELDFSDMITIDQDKLASAFQFNLNTDSMLTEDQMKDLVMGTSQKVVDNINNSAESMYQLLTEMEKSLTLAMIQGYETAFTTDSTVPDCAEYVDPNNRNAGCKVPEGQESDFTEVSEGVFIETSRGYLKAVTYNDATITMYQETFFSGDIFEGILSQVMANMNLVGVDAKQLSDVVKESVRSAFMAYVRSAKLLNTEGTAGDISSSIFDSEQYQTILDQLSANFPDLSREELDQRIKEAMQQIQKTYGENIEEALLQGDAMVLVQDLSTLDKNQIIADALNEKEIKSQNLVNATEMAKNFSTLLVAQGLGEALAKVMEPLTQMMNQDLMKVDTQKIAEAFQFDYNEEELSRLMETMMSSPEDKTYHGNLLKLGYQDLEDPTSISLYFKNFDGKEHALKFIDTYNENVGDETKEIKYTDITGILMGSVKTIVNAVTYVLIAFVSISLIVSSIMIGVITLISVMERTKEIGILRAIGASKRDVGHIFNAETFIIGLLSGLIGVTVSWLLLIPINKLLYHLTEIAELRAILPVSSAAILIAISVILTLFSGLIPSRSASNKNPVEALRTE